MMNLRKQFLFYSLARLNPSLPPRRKEATADRWVQAIYQVAVYLEQLETANEEQCAQLFRWAAHVMLNSAADRSYPPGYTPLYDGGVEWAALSQLGEMLLLDDNHPKPFKPVKPTADQWRAWALLYPATAALGEPVTSGVVDPDLPAWQMHNAMAEWELIPSPAPPTAPTHTNAMVFYKGRFQRALTRQNANLELVHQPGWQDKQPVVFIGPTALLIDATERPTEFVAADESRGAGFHVTAPAAELMVLHFEGAKAIAAAQRLLTAAGVNTSAAQGLIVYNSMPDVGDPVLEIWRDAAPDGPTWLKLVPWATRVNCHEYLPEWAGWKRMQRPAY